MSREPSMEEILSSIRRVIARDEAAQGEAIEARFGDAVVPADAVASDDEVVDDILDLTDIEPDAQTVAEAPKAPESAALELVSPVSADAARQSISQLTAALSQDHAPAIGGNVAAPGMTIEALAEAALKPMLKAWLDQNLPPLVERLVAREIARITGDRI